MTHASREVVFPPRATDARTGRPGVLQRKPVLALALTSLGVFVVWRVLLNVLYVLTPFGYNLPSHKARTARLPEALVHWFQFDAAWFYHLARAGYGLTGRTKGQADVVFFPLYPLLVRALAHTGLSYGMAGLLLSNACAWAAILYVYRYVAAEWTPRAARHAVACLLLFPTAFFLVAFYSESLLVLLIAASLFYATERRWTTSAVLAGLASATKVIGVLLLPVLLVMWWRSPDRRRRDAWCFLLAPSGLVAFMAFQWVKFGDPFLFIRVEKGWQHSFGLKAVDGVGGFIHRTIITFPHAQSFIYMFEIVCVIGLVVVAVALYRERKPAAAMLCASIALLQPLSGNLMSTARYSLAAVPMFGWLGERVSSRKRILVLYVLLAGTSLVRYLWRFLAGKWVG